MIQHPSALAAPVSHGAPFRRVLIGALAAYLILVSFLAIRQSGYINADFVGYATIAHRILLQQGEWISGCWSPLISWCMVPLLAAGFGDLVAGRLVLILGGMLYLLANYGIAERFHGPDPQDNLFLTAGLMTCAVLQAAEWATLMLDPDILAAGLLSWCLFLLLDPALPLKPRRALLAGLIAGLAYLAKSYMLPFLLLLAPLTLLLRCMILPMRSPGEPGTAAAPSKQIQRPAFGLRYSLRPWVLFLAGLALVAGPWIAVLSAHYHHVTFSTAGSSNHANVGPGNFRNDPMWNQGLLPDFIADPFFGPDWSAFRDSGHLVHQARVFLHNAINAAGHCAPWLILLVGAAVSLWVCGSLRRKKKAEVDRALLSPVARFTIFWCLLAAAIYVGGYCMIDIQPRYFVAVVAPLLCLTALVLVLAATAEPPQIHAGSSGKRAAYRSLSAVVIIITLSSGQDIYRMWCIVVEHPQSSLLSRFEAISQSLTAANLPPGRIAATNYHFGLYVGYAWNRRPNYMGAPLAGDTDSLRKQLKDAGIRIYLRWLNPLTPASQLGTVEAFAPGEPWHRVLTTTDTGDVTRQVDVYVLPAPEDK